MTRTIRLIPLLAVCAFGWAGMRGGAQAPANAYERTVLVANRPELAEGGLVDRHLLNPWGIALRPPGAGGHFWVSNAGNFSTSTYIGDVNGVALHQDGLRLVYFDSPLISYEDGIANVTGQVYNAASDLPNQPLEFPVAGTASDLSGAAPRPLGVRTGTAKFVFVTTEGTIHAWRASTAESMDRAVIVKDYSDHGPDQIRDLPRLPAFTGVAMSADSAAKNRLYVADFQNKIIRVLDNRWNDITARVPFARPFDLPEDFSPYNIQLLDGRLYVTFAEVDMNGDEAGADIPGPGRGRVAAYDLDGRLLLTFADDGRLNSPWGVAIAPKDFGPLSGALLVGNFGDGTIAAFNPVTGAFVDHLKDTHGKPLELDGLWGLAVGNGVGLGDADSLYYTAGPNMEQDGVFGRVRHASASTRK